MLLSSQKPFLEVPANTEGRDFIVGDIHGCKTMLLKALKQKGFNFKKDRLFSVGDLFDRGPESYDLLTSLDDMPWLYPIKGNHEMLLINSVDTIAHTPYLTMGVAFEMYETVDNFFRNGGSWVQDFTASELWPYVEKLRALPSIIKVAHPSGDFFLGHASFHNILFQRFSESVMREWEDTPRDVLWSRKFIKWHLAHNKNLHIHTTANETPIWLTEAQPYLGQPLPGPFNPSEPLHYCGHTILPNIIVADNVVHLDTGAVLHHLKDSAKDPDGYFSIVEHASFIQELNNWRETSEENTNNTPSP